MLSFSSVLMCNKPMELHGGRLKETVPYDADEAAWEGWQVRHGDQLFWFERSLHIVYMGGWLLRISIQGYCWWKTSQTTTWDVKKYLEIMGFQLPISTGDFSHQQYHYDPWNFEVQKVNGRSSSTSSWDLCVLPGPFCSCLFCRGSNWGEQYKSNMREIRLRRQLYHSRRNMIFQEHNELMKSSDFFLTSSTPPKGFSPSP